MCIILTVVIETYPWSRPWCKCRLPGWYRRCCIVADKETLVFTMMVLMEGYLPVVLLYSADMLATHTDPEEVRQADVVDFDRAEMLKYLSWMDV